MSDAKRAQKTAQRFLLEEISDDAVTAGLADDYFRARCTAPSRLPARAPRHRRLVASRASPVPHPIPLLRLVARPKGSPAGHCRRIRTGGPAPMATDRSVG